MGGLALSNVAAADSAEDACGAGVVAGPLPATAPAAAGFSVGGLARLDEYLNNEVLADRIPGAVVAIARDGLLVHHGAYGLQDPERKIPMQLDTMFSIASMTKPMTAVAALQLTEEGRLSLKTRLSDYYPDFARMKVGVEQPDGSLKLDDQVRPILIHDLLRHTASIPYFRDDSTPVARLYPDGRSPMWEGDLQALVDRLTRLPLSDQPGSAFEYGFSSDILGGVIEKVTGQRLGEVLRTRIWEPLKMKDTTVTLDELTRARMARPLPKDPLTGRPQSVDRLDKKLRFDCGGWCAIGTVGDYLRFGQALLNGGILDGERFLSPSTVEHMTSNHLVPTTREFNSLVSAREGIGFGLGISVRTQDGIAAMPGSTGQFGWYGTWGSIFTADPRQKLAIVFATTATGREMPRHQLDRVVALVYGAMTR